MGDIFWAAKISFFFWGGGGGGGARVLEFLKFILGEM